ncbi:hypothetical protein T552_00027 [Pneumocystis carinii B80]|uniref:COX assembly mitochondrial protein n=1 Tax=Pneumocystis carinii (strain B80) TaxID=1408658 RepID=A0A0W4ZSN5_PNEC8|nr:hypothetical protein T552_00027 [Pneumocystis carinii B80]KTW31382.1 hypothetical protein T552_00027 [Pneumocystis carinii B80]
MHPPLSAHKHPDCHELMKQLKECHESNFISHFFGKCNDLKKEVVKCLNQERLKQQRENQRKNKDKRR